MLRIVASERCRARTMPLRSPFTRVIPGAFHRNIGAGAHGDADVGCSERRRVVDAVTGHGERRVTLGPKLVDQRLLAFRQHIGPHFVDAEMRGDGLWRSGRCRRWP